MLPASRTRSSGRMSAPFHDAASTASTTPQTRSVPRPWRGNGWRSGWVSACILFLERRHLLVEARELPLDVGELRLLFGRRHALVLLHGDLGLEQLELADRQQLVVVRRLEAADVDLVQRLLLALVLAVAHEEL